MAFFNRRDGAFVKSLFTLLGLVLANLASVDALDPDATCRDVVATSICQSQILQRGLNSDGEYITCVGEGALNPAGTKELNMKNDGQYPHFCDLSCGFLPCTSPPWSGGGFVEKEEEDDSVISDWVWFAAPSMILVASAYTYFIVQRSQQSHSRVTKIAAGAILVLTLLIVGQGCKSFSVAYDVGASVGTNLNYDFYEGVSDLYNAGSPLLAAMMLVFSGFWPISKQFLTIWTVGGNLDPKVELKYLRWLGLTGKTAFLDIGIVTTIVALLNIKLLNEEMDIDGDIISQPEVGVIIVVIGLVGSRVLTTTLIHVFPPKLTTATNDLLIDNAERNYKKPGFKTLICAALAPVFGVLAFVLPFVTRFHLLEIRTAENSEEEPTFLDGDEVTFTLPEMIDASRGSGVARSGLYFLTLVFVLYAGAIHIFATPVALLFNFYTDGKSKHNSLVCHLLRLCNEWASLDVFSLGVIALGSQMEKMAGNMSERMGYDAEFGGSYMTLRVDGRVGVYLGLLAGFFATVACHTCCHLLEDVVEEDEESSLTDDDILKPGAKTVPV